MKKILFVLLTLFVAAQATMAVPALRGKYPFKQPDGTVITLENHGDEYYHWTTDGSGNTMEMDAKGFYRRVAVSPAEHRARYARALARGPYRARWSSYEEPFSTNFGDRKILCLLAEFQPETEEGRSFDGKYTVSDPYQHFYDMLNKKDYNEDGAIGSVRDYFVANSLNQYRPTFDVFICPEPLQHPESYYDENGVALAIFEMYEQLQDQISIADYDTDNDGNLDMVLFYFPGHNEAEHAPSWTIWPHQGSGYYGTMGGKRLVRYFCTSELRGSEGDNPAAIGTTCHEFAHSLGLPDFYDVGDDANGGSNGIDECTYTYDLMCYGNYNDNGRRPPYLTSLERNMLGWMPMPPAMEDSGSVAPLAGVENNVAYRIDGRFDGEFFLLECRTKEGWDSATPMYGLVVFHVDQSSREIANGVTATSLWESTNNINSYGGHPCYRIVPSISPIEYLNDFAFPGRGITTFSPTDWDGQSVGMTLTNIQYSLSAKEVSFGVSVSDVRQIFGYVTDADGQPMQNVAVVRSPSLYGFAAPAYLQNDQVCMTDADGYYSFTLDESASEYQVIAAQKDGYVSRANNVSASNLFTRHDFVLLRLGEAPHASLRRYDPSLDMVWGAHLNLSSMAVGMKYSASDLSSMNAVGSRLSKISFLGDATNGESVYLVVDFGNEIVLREEVTSYTAGSYVTVDVSDKNIMIPQGKDVYIGYGFTGIQTDFPFPVYGPMSAANDGHWYWGESFLTSTSKGRVTFGGYYDFVVSAVLTRDAEIDFASYGVSYVGLVDGVPQVAPAAGKTVYSVTWYVDGTAVDGTPPAVSELTSGTHTYKAVLQYYDGTSERVYYDVNKE